MHIPADITNSSIKSNFLKISKRVYLPTFENYEDDNSKPNHTVAIAVGVSISVACSLLIFVSYAYRIWYLGYKYRKEKNESEKQENQRGERLLTATADNTDIENVNSENLDDSIDIDAHEEQGEIVRPSNASLHSNSLPLYSQATSFEYKPLT